MPKNQIFLLTTIIAIYSFLIFSIGFLADDFDLLHRAQNQNYLLPLETHHYSLLTNSMFHVAPKWISHPVLFHSLAIAFHVINIALLGYFLKRYLKLPHKLVFPITLLFAINLPGIEALLWCCALPYVVNTTLILCSMIIYCDFLEEKRSAVLTSVILSAVLIIGIITWEWIVLVVPILFACATLLEGPRGLLQKITPLISLVGILLITYFVRSAIGLNTGYQVNSLVRVVGTFISSPFVALFPFLPKEFYSSAEGVLAASVLFFLIAYLSIKNLQLRFFFALFLASMIPTAISGHPQSRYFYFATFPLYSFGILLIAKATKFRMLFSLWYVACLFLAISRIHTWQKASDIVTKSRLEIQSLIEQSKGPITVLNLPDKYGKAEKIWRPPMWSGGFESYKGLVSEKSAKQGTPVYQFLWTDGYESYQIKKVET